MRRFALDHNFPIPIVEALREFIAEAELVSLRDIDRRLVEMDDWELLLALHHDSTRWDGLITNDAAMLRLPRELSVLLETKLKLVVADDAGHDPLKATGLVFAHLPQICQRLDPDQAQVWPKTPEKPRELLAKLALEANESPSSNRASVLEALANPANDVITIVAHGTERAIFLPDGTKIDVNDILSLPDPPAGGRKPLVVLLACNTGKGLRDGTTSIAQALLMRGRAAAVVGPTENIPAGGKTSDVLAKILRGEMTACTLLKEMPPNWQTWVELLLREPVWRTTLRNVRQVPTPPPDTRSSTSSSNPMPSVRSVAHRRRRRDPPRPELLPSGPEQDQPKSLIVAATNHRSLESRLRRDARGPGDSIGPSVQPDHQRHGEARRSRSRRARQTGLAAPGSLGIV